MIIKTNDKIKIKLLKNTFIFYKQGQHSNRIFLKMESNLKSNGLINLMV